MHCHNRISLRLLAWLVLLPLLVPLTAVVFAKGNTQPPPTAPAELSGNYTRIAKTGDDAYALELAIRTFRPATGTGSAVTLISAIHIGSAEYYAVLQKIIDAHPLLLFEGVSKNPDDFKKQSSTKITDDGLYGKIAHATGLVTQLESIRYDRAHFKNADLSMAHMKSILAEEARRPGTTGAVAREAIEHLDALEQMLAGNDGGVGYLFLRGVIGLVENSAPIRTLFLFVVANAEDGGNAAFQTRGIKRLMRLILDDRNSAAMKMLNAELTQKSPPPKIGLFYGAAHMRGMEKILVHDMNYRLSETHWIQAYTLHPQAAGLSAEVIKGLTFGAIDKTDQSAPTTPAPAHCNSKSND